MKLGSLALIDAEAEHAERCLGTRRSWSSRNRTLSPDCRSARMPPLSGFSTTAPTSRLAGLTSKVVASTPLIEAAQNLLASVPVIMPVDLERQYAAQHQFGMFLCARPRTSSPRTTWTRSTSSGHFRACGSRPGAGASRLEPRQLSSAANAITTDEGLIDDLVNEPTVSNGYTGEHCTYETAAEVPHDGFLADFLMRSIDMIRA